MIYFENRDSSCFFFPELDDPIAIEIDIGEESIEDVGFVQGSLGKSTSDQIWYSTIMDKKVEIYVPVDF